MSNKAQEIKVTRTQTGVRIETRKLKVLKAPTEYYALSLGDLSEGIVLHAYQGLSPFEGQGLKIIAALKKVYGMDYDASSSHPMIRG